MRKRNVKELERAMNIRHYLTEEMLVNAGHIGDGIYSTFVTFAVIAICAGRC